MDRIDAMQAFVTVADLQGFAPAARKLGLSPSGVTRLIAALEDRLGARLLQRTTRQVVLTDVGARYLERVRRILADVEEAEGSAQAERTRPSGRLVSSAPRPRRRTGTLSKMAGRFAWRARRVSPPTVPMPRSNMPSRAAA